MTRNTVRRCRICRAEEGKQHKFSCTFDRYQRQFPSASIYTTDYSSSSGDSGSSSSCDTGPADAGSCG